MADYRAVISQHARGWVMTVKIPGEPGLWPTWDFPDGIPTRLARTEALRKWGYEIPAGTDWDWHESTNDNGTVALLAGVHVRQIQTPAV